MFEDNAIVNVHLCIGGKPYNDRICILPNVFLDSCKTIKECGNPGITYAIRLS